MLITCPMSKRYLPLAIAAVAGSVGVGPLAFAETASDDGLKLEEIIITAQKREQDLQSVGVSVTAFDAKSLENLGLNDPTEIAGQVPGLQFNQYGASVTIYNLRGVSQNDFTDHQEAPVAVYADDAYVASTGALAGAMFDLQRVEVLRGPQGTLFGRNATGGLIHYVSQKPSDRNEGFVNASFGNYGSIETEGAVNTRLSDNVDGRLSFATNYRQGYITNTLGHSINDQNQYAARAQVLFKLNGGGEVVVKLHAITNDNETPGNYSWAAAAPDATGRGAFVPGGTDLVGYQNPSSDPFTQSEDRRSVFNRTVWGTTVHASGTLGSVGVTSITDYLHLQKRYGEDSDVSPNPIFNYDVYQHYQQVSEELRFNGDKGGFRWIGGLYYLYYDTKNLAIVSLDPGFGGTSYADYRLSTSTAAAFAQVEYDLAAQWTMIAGARYTYDDKKFNMDYEPQGLIYDPAHYPSAARSFNIPTGKLELDYKPLMDTLTYASVNWGAKGGGWSAVTSGVADPNALPYDTERLTSYEVGFKSTFLDGAARLNGAVFYYDYKGYQGFFLNGLTQVVQNKDARIKGGELEFAVVPAKGLNIQLGISNLNSEATDIPLPAGGFTTTEMPQAPKWSVNAVVRYEWPALSGKLALEADTKWSSKQYMELLNNPDDLEPAHAVSNARVTYASGSGVWDVGAYVRNLADTRYRVYNLDLSSLGFAQGVYGAPRTYGASFAYHWGT